MKLTTALIRLAHDCEVVGAEKVVRMPWPALISFSLMVEADLGDRLYGDAEDRKDFKFAGIRFVEDRT